MAWLPGFLRWDSTGWGIHECFGGEPDGLWCIQSPARAKEDRSKHAQPQKHPSPGTFIGFKFRLFVLAAGDAKDEIACLDIKFRGRCAWPRWPKVVLGTPAGGFFPPQFLGDHATKWPRRKMHRAELAVCTGHYTWPCGLLASWLASAV